MQAAVFTGPYKVELMEQPIPVIERGEALIRVCYSGLCGSDLTIYAGKNARAKSPLIPGHEVVGKIADIKYGDLPSDFAIGDSVAYIPTLTCGACELCKSGSRHLCSELRFIGIQLDGGFAEYVKVPIENLYRIPEELSVKTAVLTEPLAVAVHAVGLARIRVDDTVVVIGGGPIGLLVALMARLSGANVIITEISSQRVAIAKSLGFDAINSAESDSCEIVRDITKGRGAEVVFECAGHASTIPQLIQVGGAEAQLIVVGALRDSPPVDLFTMSRKEQSLLPTWTYRKDDFRRALNLLARGVVSSEKIITHTYSLGNVVDALSTFRAAGQAIKVILDLSGC